jgi:hypothetical protein
MYCVEVTNLAPLPFDPRFKNARPPRAFDSAQTLGRWYQPSAHLFTKK